MYYHYYCKLYPFTVNIIIDAIFITEKIIKVTYNLFCLCLLCCAVHIFMQYTIKSKNLFERLA